MNPSSGTKCFWVDLSDCLRLQGFTDGVMITGPHAGKKVSDAKPLIKQEMVVANQALAYSEPEKTVISRSGDECVVALTDQWCALAFGSSSMLSF